jgi:large subunit ribosomal protein L21
MYAVIETGGKQYRVEVGTELEVELLEANAGDSINLPRVLLVADGDTSAIGQPLVANASVEAEVVRRDRGPKLTNFKYGPKTRRRVKKGHRQELTILRISDIVLDGKSAAGEKAEADKARRAERARLEETARRQAAADAEIAAKLAADKAAKSAAEAKASKATAKASRTTTRPATKTAAKSSDTKTPAAKTATTKTAGGATAKSRTQAGAPKTAKAATPKPKTKKKDG